MNSTEYRITKTTFLSVTPDGDVNLLEKISIDHDNFNNFYVDIDRNIVRCKKVLDLKNPVKDFTFRLLPGYVETRLDVTDRGELQFDSKGFLPITPLFKKYCKFYHVDIRLLPHVKIFTYRNPFSKVDMMEPRHNQRVIFPTASRAKNPKLINQIYSGVPCPQDQVKLVRQNAIRLSWLNENKNFSDDFFIEIPMNYNYEADELFITVIGTLLRVEAEHEFEDNRLAHQRMLKCCEIPQSIDLTLLKAAINVDVILVYLRNSCP